jgi:hypothetical protein
MKNGEYVMLGAGIVMCLAGAYSMITGETRIGIIMGGAGVLFIGASSMKRKKKK